MSANNGTNSTAQLSSEIPLEQLPVRAQLRIAVLALICANITCAVFMILRTIVYTRRDRKRVSTIVYSSEFTMPRPAFFCKCWYYWLARQRPFETDDVFPVFLSFGTVVQGIMLLWVVTRALNGAAPTSCSYESEVAWTAIWITPFITLVFLMECMIRAISTPRLKARGRYTVQICAAIVFFLLILVWIPTRVMDVPEDEFCNGQLMSYLNQFSSGGTGLIALLIPMMLFLIMMITMHLFKDPEVSEQERTSASKTVYYSLCTIVQWCFIIPFFATSSMTQFPEAPVFMASIFLNISGLWISTISLYIRANLAKIRIQPLRRYSTLDRDRTPPPLPEKDISYLPSTRVVERVQPNSFPYNVMANESTIQINIEPISSPRTPRRPVPSPIQTTRIAHYNGVYANNTRSISTAATTRTSVVSSLASEPPTTPERPMSGRTLIPSMDYSTFRATTGYPGRKSQLFSPISAISSNPAPSPQAFSFVATPRHFFARGSAPGLPASPASLRTNRHNREESNDSTSSQTTLLGPGPRVILPRSRTTTAAPSPRLQHTHSRSQSTSDTLNPNQTVVVVTLPRLQVPHRSDSRESRTLGSDRLTRSTSMMTRTTSMNTVGTLPIMFDVRGEGDVDEDEGLGGGGYSDAERELEREMERVEQYLAVDLPRGVAPNGASPGAGWI